MKKLLLILASSAFVLCASCSGGGNNETPIDGPDTPVVPEPEPEPEPEPAASAFFAKGADIGWLTEMEAKKYKFYNASGSEMECTALLKSIGFNSVRYRVWVNPSAGYNNKEDVLVKCRRARDLGMKIMIDFHYSDTWADPSKQIVPLAWQGYGAEQMAKAVAGHTKEVLQALKDEKIDVEWVQVGNEVTPGMLMHTGTEGNVKEISSAVSGKVSGSSVGHFVEYFNVGREAVKEVYPDAKVILHIDNGWKLATLTWFYDLMKENKLEYDIIGLSLYPSYWENNGYPDWSTKTRQCVSNFSTLNKRYGKPVMLVEFGMPASEPEKAKAALQYVLDGVKDSDWFGGVFYWEPESEKSRNNYEYGAFAGGKPTAALDPFAE
ncbi:MAG: glycosyl hydrolase 53 family protein [Bacteroidales bacterium]|nr:glycosyl hydrolase 53 family protein [Bacteroidales bacterium]